MKPREEKETPIANALVWLLPVTEQDRRKPDRDPNRTINVPGIAQLP